MLAAEWVALTNALLSHPHIRSRVDPPWRVKRMEPDELRRLAVEMGVNMEPIRERVAEVSRTTAMAIPRHAPNQPTRTRHEGAFAGVMFFPLVFELLGSRVEREARVSWGYTPAWDHYDRRRRCIVSGAQEAFSMLLEVEARPDNPALRMCQDGQFRPRPQQPRWVPLDLLGDGMLPDGLNREIERQIDQEAREQDCETQRGCFSGS